MMRHFHKAQQVEESAPVTRGHTIRWAYAYDFIVRVFTLNREGALREETLRLAGIKRGASVLDVGCGTGSLTLRAKLLAGSEGQVHGIDAAPEMIAKARRKAHAAGAQVDFQVGVIEALDFADGTFDRVLSSLMMHHLPGALQGQGLAEVRRECIPPPWSWAAGHACRPGQAGWAPGSGAKRRLCRRRRRAPAQPAGGICAWDAKMKLCSTCTATA